MKKLFILLIAASGLLTATAQQGQKVIKDPNAQVRSVGSFNAIAVADGIDLYLSMGNDEAVAVSANKDEYREKIVTKVEDGVLRIYFGRDNGFSISWKDRKLRAYVSAKSINALRASGGSDVIIDGNISGAKLSLDLSGGSDFMGAVSVSDQLTIEASGGSDVKVSGKATNVKIDVSGGSDVMAYDLAAEYVIAQASGGSDAQISVAKELYAEASGGSDINYKGTPVLKRNSSSGGGSVSRRNK